ncbi:MAG: hypothetical protein QW374_03935 [Candidatus Bathyarchaeia archaeon]|nr:hypothetical protein [Candidatus Bathyarchaeota archaeon]
MGKFASYGTDRSKGTKVFCITGSAARTAVVEVPIDITVKDLIFKLAGGVREEKI